MSDNNFSPSVLLYHVYTVKNWKNISQKLLENVPHTDIYVNISIEWTRLFSIIGAFVFFARYPKVKKIFITFNRKSSPEVDGFNKFKTHVPWEKYALMTYIHGKGVTKPQNKNIQDWVEMMRYFLLDRMDLCYNAFENGYKLYGVNLSINDEESPANGPRTLSDFHYSGNFVSVNLNALRDKLISTPIDKDYFGLESFWGKLCKSSEAFSAHISMIDHYDNTYPENLYKFKD